MDGNAKQKQWIRSMSSIKNIWLSREAEEDAFKGRGSEVVAKQKLGHSLGEH